MKSLMLALTLTMAASAHSAIICEADVNDRDNKVKITIDGSTIKVEHTTAPQKVFNNVRHEWDGHMSGLYTAPGIALKYENHYGCIAEVVVITDVDPKYRSIQALQIPTCINTEYPGCSE